jgi:hypothetical protein
MEIILAAPTPKSIENAMEIVMSGMASASPPSAASPTPRPTKMRSTTL